MNRRFASSLIGELQKWLARFILGLRPAFGLWSYLLFHIRSLGVRERLALATHFLAFKLEERID